LCLSVILPSIKRNCNKFACWQSERVQRELGFANKGPLGATDSSGFSTTFCRSGISGVCSPTDAAVSRVAKLAVNKDTDTVRKTSNKCDMARSERLYLTRFFWPSRRIKATNQ